MKIYSYSTRKTNITGLVCQIIRSHQKMSFHSALELKHAITSNYSVTTQDYPSLSFQNLKQPQDSSLSREKCPLSSTSCSFQMFRKSSEAKLIMECSPRRTNFSTFSSATNTNGTVGTTDLHQPAGIILGIETSCDETGAAVVTTSGLVLGEALASQAALHAQFGGVMPVVARGEHEKAIDGVVAEALSKAQITEHQLSAVAVTIGPGLSLCLRVGVSKARSIARSSRLPLIGVHHMEAHALVVRLADPSVEFPFLTLLISGGHNLLLLAHGIGRYTELGSTLDDALGEAYDKIARLLGLDLAKGGGPALEEAAKMGDPLKYKFTVPMKHLKNCDFSYAGLKTAVRIAVERHVPHAESVSWADASVEDRQIRADIAASFQSVAVKHLEQRTVRAIENAKIVEPLITCLVVAGGVASNAYVRSRLQEVAESGGVRLVCPPARLCTDNGVMVAWAGVERFKLGLLDDTPPENETEDWRVDVRPRWPLGEAVERTTKNWKSQRKRDVFPSLTSMSQETEQVA